MLLLTNRLRIRGRFTDQVDPVKGFRFFEFPENGIGETPSELTIRKAVAKITPAAVALTPSSLPGEVLINVHGYNNSLTQAWERTQGFHSRLSEGGYHSFPICVSWPSNGKMTGYLDDRLDTQNSVPSFVNFLANLHEEVQLGNPRCTVNLNLIAHSMGSLLVRDGIQELWKRQGMPVSFPMLNEVLLVGSDIDADSLNHGNSGAGIPALSRRVTVYFNRHDGALLASQRLKSRGVRRLGRTGPADWSEIDARVTAVDCSQHIQPTGLPGIAEVETHGKYFTDAQCLKDMCLTLQSVDRNSIPHRILLPNSGGKGFVLSPV